jgi:multiple sugar transport system permease protein
MTDVAAKKHHTKSGLWARITSPKNRGPLLIAPAIIVLFVMNIFPLLWSFGLSFFNYRANRLNVPEFVGLKNFERVLTDEKIWDRFQTTAIIVGSSVTLQLIIGFSLAMLFAKHFPMRRIIMMLVLTPMMLSFVSVGVFFKLYYEPTFGLLSWFINLFTTEPFALLSTSTGALIGIIFADAWMWSPFVMLLVLAGLVSVPKYLYEAAEIDRVSSWRRFVTITLPISRVCCCLPYSSELLKPSRYLTSFTSSPKAGLALQLNPSQ